MRAARTIFSLVGGVSDYLIISHLLEPRFSAGSWSIFTPLNKHRRLEKKRKKKKPSRARSDIPGLADVDNVHTISTSLPEVRLHVQLEVLAAQVALSCEQHLNVLRRGIEDGGEVSGRHFECSLLSSSRVERFETRAN